MSESTSLPMGLGFKHRLRSERWLAGLIAWLILLGVLATGLLHAVDAQRVVDESTDAYFGWHPITDTAKTINEEQV